MLRSVMAVPQASEETQQLQRAAYLSTLTKYPAWAVEEACARFLGADVGEGIHAPKPGEIAAVCRKLIAEAQYERAKINAVLDAEVYSPPTEEQRAEIAKAMEDFAADMAKAARNPEPTPAGTDAAERADHLADLAARKAKREAEDQSSLSDQLRAGREPFEAQERGGKAA